MQTHFEKELSDLKEKLLTMASYAESSVRTAVEALERRDADLAQRARDGDEAIDRFEVEVDELAIRLLSKAPLATDLRLIAMVMKISQNLERVGDEATKIARRARDLAADPPLKLSFDISAMVNLSLEMLKSALDAFVAQDSAAARTLIPRDREVDEMNRDMHGQLAEHMMRHPETVWRCLNLMVVVKSLERIADHAKNIAEEVIYLCEAEDIRHRTATPTTSS